MNLKTISIWTLLFAINILGILPLYNYDYPASDIGETLYHVRELEIGRIPYKDIFTHHFLGYAVLFYWIEKIIPLTPKVFWSLGLIFNFINSVLIFLILKKIANKQTAYIGALLAVTIGWFPGWNGWLFNVQTYFLPFFHLYLLLMIYSIEEESRDYFLLSLFVYSVLITFDQRLLVFTPLNLFPFFKFASFRTIKSLTYSIISILLIPTLCLSYLSSYGAIHDFVFETFMFPLFYRNKGIRSDGLYNALFLIRESIRHHISYVILAVIGYITLYKSPERNYLKSFFPICIIFCFLYAAVGGRVFTHYLLILYPQIILLISIGFFHSQNFSNFTQKILQFSIFLVIGISIFSSALCKINDCSKKLILDPAFPRIIQITYLYSSKLSYCSNITHLTTIVELYE